MVSALLISFVEEISTESITKIFHFLVLFKATHPAVIGVSLFRLRLRCGDVHIHSTIILFNEFGEVSK